MPYSIELPDGTLVQDIPDALDPKEAKRRIYEKRPDLAPKTTVGGQLSQLPAAAARGLVGTLGGAAQGIAALALPESLEKPTIEKLRAAQEALTPSVRPGYEETIPTKLAETLGSAAGFLLPGTAGARIAGGIGRVATTVPVAAGAGASEAMQRAEQAGATPEQISTATGLGTVVGLSELLPVERYIGVLRTAKKAVDLNPGWKKEALRVVKEAAVSGGVEGAQEVAAGFAQNLIAQQLYKPDQQLIEGLGEQAAYGAGAGAIVEVLLDQTIGRKSRLALQEEQKKQKQTEIAAQQAEQQALIAQQKQLEQIGAGVGAGAGQAEGPIRLQREYESARQKVEALKAQLADAAAAGDIAKLTQLDPALKQQEEALTALQTQAKQAGIEFKTAFDRADIEATLKKLRSQLQKAGEAGDVEKIRKLAPQIQENEEKLKSFSFEMGMERQAAERERAEIDAKLAAEQELKDRQALLEQQAAATEQRKPLELPERPNIDLTPADEVYQQKFNEYVAQGMSREDADKKATKESDKVVTRLRNKYQRDLDKYNTKVESIKESSLTPEERLARSQEGYEDATETARKNSFVDDIFDEIGNVIKPTGPISAIRLTDDIVQGRPVTRVIQDFQDEQNTSYFDLMNLAQDLRARNFIGGEGGVRGRELIGMQDIRKNLEAKIEETKKQYINAVLYRAAAERAALGRSGLDEDAALKLATQTKGLLDELVTRTSAPTTRVYQKEAFKRGEEEMAEDTRTEEERRFTYDDAALDRLQKLYGLDDTVLQYIRQFNKRLEELDAQRDQKLSPEVRRRVVGEFNRTFQQRAETLNEGLMRSVEKNIRSVVSQRGELRGVEGEFELTPPTEKSLSAKEAALKGEPSADRTRPVREAGDIDLEIDAKRRELEFVKAQTTSGPGLGLYGAPTTVFNKPTEIARLEREIEELKKKKTETVPGAKPSLATQLMRRRDFTANKIDQALRRGGEYDAATLNALEKTQAAAVDGTATNELMDLADEAVARRGGATIAKQIEDELKNIQQAQQGGKQADLFGAPSVERTTPARLKALSESEQRKAAEKEAKTPQAKLNALKQELSEIEKELEGLSPKEKQAVQVLLKLAREAEGSINNSNTGLQRSLNNVIKLAKRVREEHDKQVITLKDLESKLDKLKEQREDMYRKGINPRSREAKDLNGTIERLKQNIADTKAKVENYFEPFDGISKELSSALAVNQLVPKSPRQTQIIKTHWPLQSVSETEQVYKDAIDAYENIIQGFRDLAGVYRSAATREAGNKLTSVERAQRASYGAPAIERTENLTAKKNEIKSAIRTLVAKIKKQSAKGRIKEARDNRKEIEVRRSTEAALAGTARLIAEANTKATRIAEQSRLEAVGQEGVQVTSEVVYGATGQMFTVSTDETKALRKQRHDLSLERKELEEAGKKGTTEYNRIVSKISDLSIQIADKETPLLRKVTAIFKKEQPLSAEQKELEKLLDTENAEQTVEYLEGILEQAKKQRGAKATLATKEQAAKLKGQLASVDEKLKGLEEAGKKYSKEYMQLVSQRANLENLIEVRTTPFVEKIERKIQDLRLYQFVGPQTYERIAVGETEKISVDKANAIVRVLNEVEKKLQAKPRKTAKDKANLAEIQRRRGELSPLLEEAVGAAAALRRQERVTAVKPLAPKAQANFVIKAAREHGISREEAAEVVLTANSRTGVQSALRNHGPDSKQFKAAMDKAVALEVRENIRQAAESFEDSDNVIDIRSGISWRLGNKASDTDFTKERAESAFSKLKLPRGVRVAYAYTFDELPDFVKNQIPKSSLQYADLARGAVLPDGTVVLIGETHKNEADLETTAVHEITGHYGVDTLLGDSGMKALTKSIEAQSGGIMKLAEDLGPEAVEGVRQAEHTARYDSGYAELIDFVDGWGSEDPSMRDGLRAIADAYFHRGVEAGKAEAREWEKEPDYKGVGAEVEKEVARIKNKYGKGKSKEDIAIEQVRELIAYTAQQRATEGFLKKANRFIKELVGTLRAALKKMGFTSFGLDKVSTSDIYKIIRDAEQTLGKNRPGVYVSPTGQVAYRLGGTQWADTEQAKTMEEISKGGIIGKEKGLIASIKANLFGLGAATQWIDRLAPVERAAAYMKDEAQAMQMMYHLRMHDYANNATAEVASSGPLTYQKEEVERNGEKITQFTLVSKNNVSLSKIAEVLGKAKETFGDANAVNEAFSMYMAAVRAKQEKKSVLDFEERLINKEQIDKAFAAGESVEAFREARKLYKQYNEGLLDFLVETGAMSEKKRDELIKDKEYFPFYRMRDGIAELVIGDEATPITIGDIKSQPYLQQLVGGNKPILDFFTGSLQNTRLLTEMALRNQATKETAFALANSGLLEVPLDDKGNPKVRKDGKPYNGIFKGTGKAAYNVIRFKHKGDDYYAVLNEKQMEAIGIPADLFVKGMEGIRATIPAFFRAMAVPTRWLRLAITRNPVYIARQITRDSTSNWLTTGADGKPVVGAAKEYVDIVRGKSEGYKALQQRLILGGQTLTGMPDDMQKILLQITKGEGGLVSKLAAKADMLASAADAASRVRIYNDFRKQGLSDMEATIATMESMNYNKRGLSPSLYMGNMLIPFLYSQIQGLNVTYKAMFGKMPYAQKLNQRSKFWTRGMMLTGITLAYAAMMDDDETYENAGSEKYANWFVRIPGFNEPIRVPIPFEVGLMFKAIPEATIDLMKGDEDARKAVKGIGRLLMQSVPGDIPTFLKPSIEVATNYSFYNDQSIVSRREEQFLPAEQYRENTTEFAKFLGGLAGVSPIKIDYFIRGHLGSLGVATMQAMNLMALDKPDVEPPTGRASTLPIVGALFQPKDASGALELFYENAERSEKAKASFNKMVSEGRGEEAVKFAQEYSTDIALSDFSGKVRKELANLAAMRRLVLQSNQSGPEKRESLDNIRKAQIALSRAANQAFYVSQ